MINFEENSSGLSFSQMHGYEEIPSQLQLEQLPVSARTKIWNLFHIHMHSNSGYVIGYFELIDNWKAIMQSVFGDFFCRPLDDWDPKFNFNRAQIRQFIETQAFNKVFDLIQFVMNHSQCSSDFIESMKRVFESCRLAYAIDYDLTMNYEKQSPTIVPISTPEAGSSLLKSLKNLRECGLTVAVDHLHKSSKCINDSDWEGSIRESVSAVESVLRSIDPNASSDMNKALNSLEKMHGPIHPALKKGITKIYGYASDLPGARHSKVEGRDSNAGLEEALLLLGICASFANYFWQKFNLTS